eukprot:12900635-Prorocentrum_lima.AAC.1
MRSSWRLPPEFGRCSGDTALSSEFSLAWLMLSYPREWALSGLRGGEALGPEHGWPRAPKSRFSGGGPLQHAV